MDNLNVYFLDNYFFLKAIMNIVILIYVFSSCLENISSGSGAAGQMTIENPGNSREKRQWSYLMVIFLNLRKKFFSIGKSVRKICFSIKKCSIGFKPCPFNRSYFGKTVRLVFKINSVKKDIKELIFCFENIIYMN